MGYLYHVTYFNRLEGIQEHGIIPGARESIGGAGLGKHKRGRVFITAPEGVKFWFGRADDWAYHNSDDMLEDGLVPVVLRFPEPDNLTDDWIGSREARAAAYMSTSEIPADEIEAYFDGTWYPVDEYDLPPEEAFDEDGYFLESHKNPFYWHQELEAAT